MPDFGKPFISETAWIKSPFYIKYGIPLVLTVLVTLLKVWLDNYIGVKTPFLLYFGLIIIVAKFFGQKPAIIVTALSAIAVNFFFIYPFNRFDVGKLAAIQIILFLLEAGLIIIFSNALNKAATIISEKEERFRILVEKSSEGILTVNASGKITYCSPSIQNILGFTDEEFLNMAPWALLHPDEALEVKEQYYRFAAHPKDIFTITHQMRHKNGDYVWIESKMTNLLDEKPVSAVIANFTNVTERIKYDKLREDFISIASHELKTPLTSLKAYTQVLQSRFKNSPDETSASIINKIEHQISKVINMVTNLLDVTTLQQDKINLHISQFDFNLLVTEVCDAIQSTTKTHQLILQLEADPKLSADRERISQVISNIITNAIKYSPDAHQVFINSKIEDGNIVLSICDCGIGIPKYDLGHIFSRFYRVDASKDSFQGLGLGLYICAQIIGQHGGKIGADSEEGKGSTFWFSLPIQSETT